MQATMIARRVAGSRMVLPIKCLSPRSRTYTTPVPSKQELEDDPQLADYPRLPYVSRQLLPARGWWDPQMRRNFGDPMHEQEEILSMWGPDAPVVPPYTAIRYFGIATLGFVVFGVLCKYVLTPERNAIPREYPYAGLITELGGLDENKARPASEADEE